MDKYVMIEKIKKQSSEFLHVETNKETDILTGNTYELYPYI